MAAMRGLRSTACVADNGRAYASDGMIEMRNDEMTIIFQTEQAGADPAVFGILDLHPCALFELARALDMRTALTLPPSCRIVAEARLEVVTLKPEHFAALNPAYQRRPRPARVAHVADSHGTDGSPVVEETFWDEDVCGRGDLPIGFNAVYPHVIPVYSSVIWTVKKRKK
eukprot:Selendium_serpulae@DN2952_c0_g1_i4.p1